MPSTYNPHDVFYSLLTNGSQCVGHANYPTNIRTEATSNMWIEIEINTVVLNERLLWCELNT